MYSNRLRLVNRFVSPIMSTTNTSFRSVMMINKMTNTSCAAACFHVDVKNTHFVMTEEKRVFLEALKLELFSNSSSRSNVANKIKDNSQQSSTYSRVASDGDVDFDKSLENSRNLMCHKRHDVLTQQESEYFLYL